MRESDMVRLLTAVVASGLVFGSTTAIGQSLDTAPWKSGEYRVATQVCEAGQAGTQRCAKDVAAAPDNSHMSCANLKDQAKRECILEAFVLQHDQMIGGGRIERSQVAPPSGSRAR